MRASVVFLFAFLALTSVAAIAAEEVCVCVRARDVGTLVSFANVAFVPARTVASNPARVVHDTPAIVLTSRIVNIALVVKIQASEVAQGADASEPVDLFNACTAIEGRCHTCGCPSHRIGLKL